MREHPARRSFFVARGRTAAKSCKSTQGEIRTIASRILSEYREICRNFLEHEFQYMYCIYFHIILLLSYRFCIYAMACPLLFR